MAVKHVVRWGGILLAVLLLLAAVSAGVVYYLVSRLDIRAELSTAVERATGRKLTINGNVGVSLWPVIGLEAHDASLANAPGGRAPALAAMDALHVGVEIPPLLSRKVVVRQLVLDHPRIALEVDANGRPNWAFQAPPAAHPAPSAPSAPTQQQQVEQAAGAFSLRAVSINNGEVSFFDMRRNQGWAINHADLRSTVTSLDTPLIIDGALSYLDQPITLHLDISAPRAVMLGRATALKFKIESPLINADFDGATTPSTGALAGQTNASGPSLRRLASWAGAPINGGVGLEAFAVSGRLEIDSGQYAFSNAGFSLDQVRGRGDFVVMERHAKPYVSGRLELFDFDFNPYLSGVAPPPAAPAAGGQGAPAGPPGQSPAQIATVAAAPRAVDIAEAPAQTPIDFSGLHAINADLELTTHKMLFQHMQIDHAQFDLVLNDGFLAATLNQVDLYGGSATGHIQVDAREADAKFEQKLTLQGLDANRFLSDAVNFANIEGTAALDYDVTTHGRSQSDLISAAKGRAHLEVVSGALRGVNLGGVARTISNALNGDLIATSARTTFHGFSGTFAIANGALASSNLSFNTEDLAMPGVGVIDLAARRLDVRLAPRSPRGGIVIPFSARGTFDALSYNSDISGRARRDIEARISAVQAASH